VSKFEIYEAFLKTKDLAFAAAEEDRAVASEAHSPVLRSSPPSYIICQCKEENYINVIEHENVMLSLSYFKGSYVASKPTGFTNLAVSAAFLASKQPPTASLHMISANNA